MVIKMSYEEKDLFIYGKKLVDSNKLPIPKREIKEKVKKESFFDRFLNDEEKTINSSISVVIPAQKIKLTNPKDLINLKKDLDSYKIRLGAINFENGDKNE
jgi:hypothetical protein